MRAAVVYESMYSNTHRIAQQIANGLGGSVDAVVLPAPEGDEVLNGVELLVVGGPTHVHGLSRASTRRAAAEAAEKPDSGLEMDLSANGPGVRDWLSSLDTVELYAAAFDTRMTGPEWVTGRASKKIAKRMHFTGCTLVAEPESFLVTKQNELEPGELERARRWGEQLAAAVTAMPPVPPYQVTSPAGSDATRRVRTPR
jgi:hypothetical protein